MIRMCVALLAVAGALTVLGNTDLVSSVNADAKAKPKKLLRHVVLFKFKESATKDQIQHVVDASLRNAK